MNGVMESIPVETRESVRGDSQWIHVIQLVVGIVLIVSAALGYRVLNNAVALVPALMGLALIIYGGARFLPSRRPMPGTSTEPRSTALPTYHH